MQDVLFLAHYAGRTGAVILLLELLRYLKTNTKLSFSSVLLDGGVLARDFKAVSESLVLNRGRSPSIAERILKRLGITTSDATLVRRFVGRNTPKVIYAQSIVTLPLAVELKRIFRNAFLICHCHELDFSVRKYLGPSGLSPHLSEIDLIIACSDAVRSDLRSMYADISDRVRLIYEYIPLADASRVLSEREVVRTELGIPKEGFVVGSCGTRDWRKGADLIVHIARILKTQMPEAPIYFVWVGGETNSRDQLRYDLDKCGLKNVRYIEETPNPLKYLGAFDVFLLPSREDPFPLVCLEAASLGLPIICFDQAGGMPEFVREDAGIVVPFLDLEAAAQSIINLFRNPALGKGLGATARSRVVENHDILNLGAKISETIGTAAKRHIHG